MVYGPAGRPDHLNLGSFVLTRLPYERGAPLAARSDPDGWRACTLAASYPDVLAAARELTGQLSLAEREAIFAGTAASVYGL